MCYTCLQGGGGVGGREGVSVQMERRMVEGEHEHGVVVEAAQTHTLYLPIVPVRLGQVTITLHASLPDYKIQKHLTIFVQVSPTQKEYLL